ncbi:hypothetical protein G6038_29310 [Rhodococcus sp. 14C212]|uniref:DUF4286 family protein n=1 Tax=Rhodococcus sp. 14C212 TaxID=2711209 RepID=UPI0013ED431F|nr:DUF4286 family protein [Rhodococcus sp. 14C212]NGP09492.1 hypothetical protein [Rhodococcus sp. 14C212]
MASDKHVWVVQTECVPGREEEFNKWYDEQHVPDVLAVPGIKSVQRYQLAPPDENPVSNRWLAIWQLEGDIDEIRATLATGRDRRPRSDSYVHERTVYNFYTLRG